MNNKEKKRVKRKKKLQGRSKHELNLLNRDRKTAEERRLSSKKNREKNAKRNK